MDIKDCPFCGSSDVSPDSSFKVEGPGGHKWIVCESCGGSGHLATTDEEATDAWNKRVN